MDPLLRPDAIVDRHQGARDGRGAGLPLRADSVELRLDARALLGDARLGGVALLLEVTEARLPVLDQRLDLHHALADGPELPLLFGDEPVDLLQLRGRGGGFALIRGRVEHALVLREQLPVALDAPLDVPLALLLGVGELQRLVHRGLSFRALGIERVHLRHQLLEVPLERVNGEVVRLYVDQCRDIWIHEPSGTFYWPLAILPTYSGLVIPAGPLEKKLELTAGGRLCQDREQPSTLEL